MIRTKEDAKKALEPCEYHSEFYMCDGRRVNSIPELLKALRKTKKEVYEYHVNESKNDFSMWINDVFQDSTLARDIYKLSKASAIKKIQLRVKELQKRSK